MSVTNMVYGANANSYPDIWNQPARSALGDYTFIGRSRKETSQNISAASDISEMEIPLKAATAYSFSFDILYSTTGLLCGAQFSVTFTGTVINIGYGITLATIANAIVSDATTTAGTFLGSSASVAGGGPKTARVTGALSIGGTNGGNLVIRCQPTGVAASVTIHPNSCGKAEEQ